MAMMPVDVAVWVPDEEGTTVRMANLFIWRHHCPGIIIPKNLRFEVRSCVIVQRPKWWQWVAWWNLWSLWLAMSR